MNTIGTYFEIILCADRSGIKILEMAQSNLLLYYKAENVSRKAKRRGMKL